MSPASPNPPRGRRFRPEHHVRSGLDFRRAYARRCTVSDQRIIVVGRENGLEHSRLGLSVSRKVGKAIVRNRWKRLLREAFRLSMDRLPKGVDLIVIPRPDAKPELAGLMESLVRLAGRIPGKLARAGGEERGTKGGERRAGQGGRAANDG